MSAVPEVQFGVEPVTGNPPMTADEIRNLVHRAGDAAERLEQMVRKLVEVRAWEVLGYENFSVMWEVENGDKASRLVKVLATYAMADEGLRRNRLTMADVAKEAGVSIGTVENALGDNQTRTSEATKAHVRSVAESIGYGRVIGHTYAEIGNAVGFPIKKTGSGGITSDPVSSIIEQRSYGVPTEDVLPGISNSKLLAEHIREHGTPARQHPRLAGAAPMDRVRVGLMVFRWQRDAIRQLASDEDVPDAEIYRRAIDQFLVRLGKNAPRGLS